MKYIDNPIGSTFKEGDVTLKVVETKNYHNCQGCWYAGRKKGTDIRNYNGSCYQHRHACTPSNRKDKLQVVFEKVKED